MRTKYDGIEYHFFWNGPFSNWYFSEFVIDNIKFIGGEQYMMYQKAIVFNDTDTAEKIMEEIFPNKQKSLGRLVKNYDDKVWAEKRYELVKKGLREKFNQNQSLKNKLKSYQGCIFVEASPYDRIWGIGFYDDVALQHIDEWGQNLLGKILTELSNEL